MASSGRVQSALIPVPRLRLSEGLVTPLQAYVEEAGLKPGDPSPPERGFAAGLGARPAPLKQAIVVLEVPDVLEVRRKGDTHLRHAETSGESLTQLADKRHHAETMEAREALECKLAELAAERRSDADLAAIGRALAHMEAEILCGGMATEGDRAFHAAVTRAAKNTVLASLVEALADDISETRVASLSAPERPPQFLAAHRRTAQAIRDGNPTAARQAMLRHLRVVASVRSLRSSLDSDDE